MSEEKKVSRRGWIKYAGAGVVVVAAAAGAGYYATQPKPTPTTPTPTTPTPTPSPGGKKLKVKIGGTKPFTGPDALIGKSEGDGNRLWVKHVNEAGGIKGGDGNIYEVELILYNDEQKPENVPRLYEKLIVEDKVDFLFGPVWGPLGMATVPVVEKYKKFEVYGTCAFDPKAYKDWRYIVHTITNGPEYMANIIDMIITRILPNDPEAKKLAITHGDDAFRATAGSYGYEYAKKSGKFDIVFYESYSISATDLTPMLTKVKAAKPTIYLNAGVYTDAVMLIRQMKELDLNVKLVWAGTGTVFPRFYEELGKLAEGTVTCTQWEKGMVFKPDFGPTHDQFLSAFEKEYNYTPDYHAATGYQQGLILQRAMELSKDPLNSDAVRKAAGEMEFTSFYGKYKVDPITGWQIGHKMGVVQWQNGQKVVVWPMEANPKDLVYPMKKWSEKV
jgi:branched-chain amino acid transport system substrate-binding protein